MIPTRKEALSGQYSLVDMVDQMNGEEIDILYHKVFEGINNLAHPNAKSFIERVFFHTHGPVHQYHVMHYDGADSSLHLAEEGERKALKRFFQLYEDYVLDGGHMNSKQKLDKLLHDHNRDYAQTLNTIAGEVESDVADDQKRGVTRREWLQRVGKAAIGIGSLELISTLFVETRQHVQRRAEIAANPQKLPAAQVQQQLDEENEDFAMEMARQGAPELATVGIGVLALMKSRLNDADKMARDLALALKDPVDLFVEMHLDKQHQAHDHMHKLRANRPLLNLLDYVSDSGWHVEQKGSSAGENAWMNVRLDLQMAIDPAKWGKLDEGKQRHIVDNAFKLFKERVGLALSCDPEKENPVAVSMSKPHQEKDGLYHLNFAVDVSLQGVHRDEASAMQNSIGLLTTSDVLNITKPVVAARQ